MAIEIVAREPWPGLSMLVWPFSLAHNDFWWNPKEGQIRHGLLYSGASGLSGRRTGAVFGRQLLAKSLLKARPRENWTPAIANFGFLTTRLKT